MRCPGQDWRYWTGEAAFEVPCPKCDAPVEFFKDETSGRCPKCGHRFISPRTNFDCAKWCAFAEQCLGSVPERGAPSDPGQGALASRLIQAVKEEFEEDQARLAHALTAFQHARELLAKEGGDPRIILTAALLLEIAADEPRHGAESAAKPPDKIQGTARVRQILEEIGLDRDTTDCVCHILDSRRMGKQLDTVEFKVVTDAEFLAKLAAAEDASGDPQRLLELAEDRLKTEAGKQKARRLVQA